VRGHMKRLFVTLSTLGMVVQVGPALASGSLETSAHARIRSVRVLENGRVRVAARYVCTTPDQTGINSLLLMQWMLGAPAPRVSKFLRSRAICDGAQHKVVRRPRLLHHQQIDPRLGFEVYINVGGGFPNVSVDQDGYVVLDDGQATRVADMTITEARFNQQGELVVAVSYKCPTGWAVLGNDPEYTYVEVRGHGGPNRFYGWDTYVGHIVCDGTTHTLVRRFGGAPLGSATQIGIDVHMAVRGPQGAAEVHNRRTVAVG
jgi:hypothetical protein